MLKLFRATIKLLIRDKEALFWSLVFPALFVIIFSFFKFGDSADARVIVIDNLKTTESQTLIKGIQNVNGVGVNTSYTSLQSAKDALTKSAKQNFEYFDTKKNSNYNQSKTPNVVLELNPSTEKGKTVNAQIFYDQASEGQASPSSILSSIIDGMTTKTMLANAHLTEPVSITRTGVSVHQIRYFDILVPGLIGMGVMQSGIIGMASGIATLKEKRILKRLSATPLPIWKFLLSQIGTHLLLSVVQITIMIVLAKVVLGANIYGSIPLMYGIAFAGNFVFLSLGFITAAMSDTARAAESMSNVFTTPMMFLSGVFFERDTLPTAIRVVANYLPLSPMLDALRAVSLQQASIWDVRKELFIVFLWTVATTLIALKVFKFREE